MMLSLMDSVTYFKIKFRNKMKRYEHSLPVETGKYLLKMGAKSPLKPALARSCAKMERLSSAFDALSYAAACGQGRAKGLGPGDNKRDA